MTNENTAQPVTPEAAGAPAGVKTYHCGSLTYTKGAIAVLFAWLIWGELCFLLMEWVIPNILPLKMKSLGCSNSMMALILTTIPGILNIGIGPYISFKSDRYRSRWGRRIPFILGSMPFLCVSLALLGFSDDITRLLQRHAAFFMQFSPTTITISLIAFFLILFQFFNTFVGSVFWGLYNDVIPAQFMSRFYGALRVFNGIAVSGVNYYIFKYAESNMREIFIGASMLYLVGFGIVCLRVKEGKYPPLKGEEDPQKSGLRVFLEQCFQEKFYWLTFAMSICIGIVAVSGTFNVFFQREMGLSLDDIGKYNAITYIAALGFMYFVMTFIDRWHPVRVSAYYSVFSIIGIFMNWAWVFVSLPGKLFFWIYLGYGLINVLQIALSGAIQMPIIVRLYPKSRFTQFMSARGIIGAPIGLLAGLAVGVFLDFIKRCCNGSDFAYRFIFVWNTFFSILVAVTVVWTYLYWYRLGGDKHYHPPAPWNKSKVEEMAIVPTVGPQGKWLNISLHLYHLVMAFSTICILPLMGWMYSIHAMVAFYWHAVLLLPLAAAAWVGWVILEKSIRRDMERSRNNEPLHNGIPHHGVLIVMGIQYLLAVGLWVMEIIMSININQEMSAIVFGVANVITNFLLIGAVWLFARVERGHLVTLDKALA